MTIQQLIASGKPEQALNQLPNSSEVVLLKSRFYTLKTNINLGLISNEEYNRELAKINYSILSLCRNDNDVEYVGEVKQISNNPKDILSEIIINNKRRRTDISDRAQTILIQYNQYEQEKLLNPSYDIVGRRLKNLNEQVNALQLELQEQKEESLEEIVEKINILISETIPSYIHLKEAYKLSSGRGMKDSWIEDQLNNTPNDNEVRIGIAEKIELFISKLNK
jgi:hypothetical protein